MGGAVGVERRADTEGDPAGREAPGAPPVRWWADALGLAWVALAALAVLAATLVHGTSLGSYDILLHLGLTARPGTVHNGFLNDPIDQMIPWAVLSWTQVHAGHLPLWNQYNALGLPLAFNWQSATFSVPSVIGYLFPVRYVYTCQVLVTLLVAGSGAYVMARVLRLGVLACVFAGVAFELSGPLFAWIGWPIASVASWAGWMLAGVLMVTRGRHRARWVVMTAMATACAVYAGQPDALVILVPGVIVFTVVLLAERGCRGMPVVRPLSDLGLSGILGVLLSAPLLLPGLQVVSGSVRAANGSGELGAQHAMPASDLVNGYLLGLVSFPNFIDFKYAGVAVAVLAVAAVVVGRRRPGVLPLAAMALLGLLLTFVNPVDVALNALPGLHAARLPRGNLLLAFGTAMLAGVGLHVLQRTTRPLALRWFGGLFVAAGALLVGVWVSGAGRAMGFFVLSTGSYLWVAAGIGSGLVAVAAGVVQVRSRSGGSASLARWLATALVIVVESAFLVTAGSGVWTSTPDGTPPSPSAAALSRIAGSSLVGLGAPDCRVTVTQLGISPNANILYGVHQLSVYDPLVPMAYYSTWEAQTGQVAGYPGVSHFCPAVTTIAQARLYGVGFILEHSGTPGPPGTVRVATIAGQDLYRVPGSGPATVVPMAPDGTVPPDGALGEVVPVRNPDPATWQVVVDRSSTEVLRLRLTDVPGWHATIDGRPLAIYPFAGIMLQMVVPAGHHVVSVTYWPANFTLGIWIAGVALVGMVAVLVVLGVRRRRASVPVARPDSHGEEAERVR